MTSWNQKAFTGNRKFKQKRILKSVWKIHAAYSFFKKIKRKNIIFLFVWERLLHSRLSRATKDLPTFRILGGPRAPTSTSWLIFLKEENPGMNPKREQIRQKKALQCTRRTVGRVWFRVHLNEIENWTLKSVQHLLTNPPAIESS